MTQLNNQWNPPDLEWIKLNSDGAWKDIACGGVIKDWVNKWIQAFYAYTGKGVVVVAELSGALKGLKLAWDLGYKNSG